MKATDFVVGDHVGIKESREFRHWTKRGQVAGIAYQPDGSPPLVEVSVPGAPALMPVPPERLIALPPPDQAAEWCAQPFPTNGDAPGTAMYFASAEEVLAFAWQFRDLQLDEVLKIRPPAGATEAQLRAVKETGAREF